MSSMKNTISPMNFINDIVPDMNSRDFADQVREWMRERDISQAELSRRSGLSPGQISKILGEKSPPGEVSLNAISEGLRIPKEVVYRAAGFLPPSPDKDERTARLIHAFSQLDDYDKDEIIEYLELKVRRLQTKRAIEEAGFRRIN